MSSFKNKLIIITGASSGIARATAVLLAERGAHLSLADINGTPLERLATSLRAQYPSQTITSTALDVTNSRAVHAWVRATVETHQQPIDGAANLAGILGKSACTEVGGIVDVDETEARQVVEVSLWGTWNCLRAQLAEGAIKRGERGRGGGSVVNAASYAGTTGVAGNGPYVAAKHAVVGLTKTAAKEMGSAAVRVNVIAPGIIATPMIKAAEENMGTTDLFGAGDPGALARKGDPEEAAQLIVYLLGDDSSFVNGQVIGLDGGWNC